MGIVAWNYVVEDEIIEKVIKSNLNIDDYIENSSENIFGQDLKVWSPMYELLKLLDKSENKVLNKLYGEKHLIEETQNSGMVCFYHSSIIKEMWSQLSSITISEIENSIENKEIVEKIIKIEGYFNERIKWKKSIVLEFLELQKAFKKAYINNKGVIIAYG